MECIETSRRRLAEGRVIPACPLALNARRHWSERHQRALVRYYRAAGAGGLAVGVHTTQFAIRDPKVGLFQPVLELAREVWRQEAGGRGQATEGRRQGAGVGSRESGVRGQNRRIRGNGGAVARSKPRPAGQRIQEDVKPAAGPVLVAGVCGSTRQAISEATIARDVGYDCALLSLGALRKANDRELLAHCRAVAAVLPLFGFYLQPAAGGRLLGYSFWRRFAEIPNVVAIKIAPFNRYQTLDVIRAVVEAGREDIALYTGNDDNIVLDLLTPFRFAAGGKQAPAERRIVGGLLGHWAVWTKRAVELHAECRRLAVSGATAPATLLRRANEVTDTNAAIFDAGNQFAGCIPGIHEVLRRQGLLPGTYCLDPREQLSPGQCPAIDRVIRAYPHLNDDAFVAEHRDAWMR